MIEYTAIYNILLYNTLI